MILVKPSFEIMEIMGIYGNEGIGRDALLLIEKAGRVCYKTEERITLNSCIDFTKKIKKLGHESVLEHSALTVRFICDRGVTHELVRHRLCAFSQESTRYCNYKGGVTFVIPPWVDIEPGEYSEDICCILFPEHCASVDWFLSLCRAERTYKNLVAEWTPQQARSVLPNSTKTEIVVTTNFREWNHIFELRCSLAAHPQMREIMIPLREKCRKLIPVIFDKRGGQKNEKDNTEKD